MKRKGLIFACSLLALLPVAALVVAQKTAASCAVRVTEPRTGQDVGGTITVEGNATLPAGHHLWVFVRRDSYRIRAVWWPQDEGLIDPGTGRWKIPATFGGSQDIGWDFDITAAVFDSQQNLQLQKYLSDSMAASDYRPIPMPAAACAAKMVTVKKTRE